MVGQPFLPLRIGFAIGQHAHAVWHDPVPRRAADEDMVDEQDSWPQHGLVYPAVARVNAAEPSNFLMNGSFLSRSRLKSPSTRNGIPSSRRAAIHCATISNCDIRVTQVVCGVRPRVRY